MALLVLVALIACACAESHGDDRLFRNTKRAVNKVEPTGCMYEGRWYSPGSAVRTREACLQCACAQGALSCRRRACAPPPEPPPRCHIIHQKGDCCPVLRCPDDLKHLELIAAARLDDSDLDTPSAVGHIFPACVEGGVVYAAGSAMTGGAACEQCFCLGGARRCVRPACLPPPPGCKARAAAGACCPQRYYCEHISSVDMPLGGRSSNDCIAPDGKWAYEGERVQAAEAECMQCFCLRGTVRCQRLACAPALRGCRPLLRRGECCPHQYQCEPRNNGTKASNLQLLQRQNTLITLADENRSFHTSKSTKRETTTRELTTHKSTSAITVTKEQPVTTMKVKRKIDDDITDSNLKSEKSYTATLETTSTTVSNDISTTMVTESTINDESTTTEQPEGSVKIIINGTINCTAELSSTSLMLNVSDPDMWIKSEAQPRIPIINNIEVESETYSPNDIITERIIGDFDENETFTINVTSSLHTNTTPSTTLPSSTPPPKTVPPLLLGSVNISKVKKDEYDYDYPEPTLPPSLPNLKIIPFVAADAVVEEDISSKESPDYPLLESNDKFPVYYPAKDTKQSFAMRKDDVYINPTQYPVFVSKKVEPIQYPSLTHEEDDVNIAYASITNDAPSQVHEYTVSTSLGNSAKLNNNIERKPPTVSTKFEMESPTVNLFSPPVETEGGFIPKGPEIIDEYFSVYQSTSQKPVIPHLTTSMQLEPKDECVTSDGRRVPEGESINVACSICSCAWGTLHCAPRPCTTPPGCERRAAAASSSDLCCGELICERRNITTPSPTIATQHFAISLNESKVPIENDKESVGFTQTELTATIASDFIKNYTTIDEENVNRDIMKDFGSTNLTQITFTEKPAQITTVKDDEMSHNSNHSIEYDDEEEDEGFSFGSVLQMLLSETYETTTVTPKRKSTTTTEAPKTTITIPTTKKFYTPPDNMFIPVTHRYPIPPKKLYPQNTVNRIDHLLLGEPTVIRKTTLRTTTTNKPVITTRKTFTPKATSRPITTKTVEITSKDGFQQTDIRPPHNFITNLSLGLPKLAGCNIYGRMYRVGRIIAELSSPCQECKCTELGVQCRSLNC